MLCPELRHLKSRQLAVVFSGVEEDKFFVCFHRSQLADSCLGVARIVAFAQGDQKVGRFVECSLFSVQDCHFVAIRFLYVQCEGRIELIKTTFVSFNSEFEWASSEWYWLHNCSSAIPAEKQILHELGEAFRIAPGQSERFPRHVWLRVALLALEGAHATPRVAQTVSIARATR